MFMGIINYFAKNPDDVGIFLLLVLLGLSYHVWYNKVVSEKFEGVYKKESVYNKDQIDEKMAKSMDKIDKRLSNFTTKTTTEHMEKVMEDGFSRLYKDFKDLKDDLKDNYSKIDSRLNAIQDKFTVAAIK